MVSRTHKFRCWGDNKFRQASSISDSQQSVSKFKATGLAAGAAHNCVLFDPRSVLNNPLGKMMHCWGLNEQGQTDIPYALDVGVVRVGAGSDNTCLVKQQTVDMQHWVHLKNKGIAHLKGEGEGKVGMHVDGNIPRHFQNQDQDIQSKDSNINYSDKLIISDEISDLLQKQYEEGSIVNPTQPLDNSKNYNDENNNNQEYAVNLAFCFGCNIDNINQIPVEHRQRVLDIVVGGFHACVIKSTTLLLPNTDAQANPGILGCWGKTLHGEADIPVANLPLVYQVAVGLFHTCALHNYGRLKCFGSNALHQLYNHTSNHFMVLVTMIACGSVNTCVIPMTGRVECRGNPKNGINTVPYEYGVQRVGSDLAQNANDYQSGVEIVAVGSNHACAVKQHNLRPVCWGTNQYNQLDLPRDL